MDYKEKKSLTNDGSFILNIKKIDEDCKYEMREWIEFCEQVRPANNEILRLVPELEAEL